MLTADEYRFLAWGAIIIVAILLIVWLTGMSDLK